MLFSRGPERGHELDVGCSVLVLVMVLVIGRPAQIISPDIFLVPVWCWVDRGHVGDTVLAPATGSLQTHRQYSHPSPELQQDT